MKKMNKVLMVLVMVFLVLMTVKGALGAVVINEVMYALEGGDEGHEWIEIYNNGVGEEELTGWSLIEAGANHGLVATQGDLFLGAGEFAILADDAAQFLADYPELAGTDLIVLDTSWGSLNDGGETLGLRNSNGELVEEVTYEEEWNEEEDGDSTEKIDYAINDNTADNWQRGNEGGTPGGENEVAPVLDQIGEQQAREGEEIRLMITATDGDPEDQNNLVFSPVVVPVGAELRNNGEFSWTPELDFVPQGDDSREVEATVEVSDGQRTDEQTFRIIVSQGNEAPIYVGEESYTWDEDNNLVLDFSDLFEDEDELSLGAGGDIENFRVVIDNEAETVTFTPTADWNGEEEITLKADDGSVGVIQAMTLIVNSVNDAPVILPIGEQDDIEGEMEVTEDEEVSIEIKARDIDNNLDDLRIDEERSTVGGVAFSQINWVEVNELEAEITPPEARRYVINVVVTDGASQSEPLTFNLTVKPALEILEDSLEIEVNGRTYATEDELSRLEVYPGEEVRVEFSVKNNLKWDSLWFVELGADKVLEDDELEMDFEGLPYSESQWRLAAGGMITKEFRFRVPVDIPAEVNEFTLRIEATDNEYGDREDISFEVEREDNNIHILADSVGLFDDNLTCTKLTTLSLNLINSGGDDIPPGQLKLLVYDGRPTNFNINAGEFETEELAKYVVEQEIETGESLAELLEIEINGSGLTAGEHTLYVYAVHPGFAANGGEAYIRGETRVALRVGKCLNFEVLEFFKGTAFEQFNLLEREEGEYKYLNEEEVLGYELEFGIEQEEEGEEGVVNCQIIKDNARRMLSCGVGQEEANKWHGEEEKTAVITRMEGEEVISEVKENFKIKVKPTLEITNVRMNGMPVEEGGRSGFLNPLDPLQVAFTLTNHMPHRVTEIEAALGAEGIAFDDEERLNLGPGETREIVLEEELGRLLVEREYGITLTAEGKDFEDNRVLRGDSFNFVLDLRQEAADVTITDLKWKDEKNETYCDQSLVLEAEYTNVGRNEEDDIEIIVKKATGERMDNGVAENLPALPPAPRENRAKIEIPLSTLGLAESESPQTLTVELSYRDGSMVDRKTINLIKHGCFMNGGLSLEEDGEGKIVDLATEEYMKSKRAEGVEERVVYGLAGVEQRATVDHNNNGRTVECNLNAAGLVTCRAPEADEYGTATLNITLTTRGGTPEETVNIGLVTVTVNPVNDGPVILLGDFFFNEDEFYEVALEEAVSDVDNELRGLTFTEDSEHIAVEKTAAGKLKFTAEEDWYGEERFNLTVRDGANETRKELGVNVAWNQNDDKARITGKSPQEERKVIKEDEQLNMNVTISDPDEAEPEVKWYIGEEVQGDRDAEFVLEAGEAGLGERRIKAVIYEGTADESKAEWTIIITDRPLDLAAFGNSEERIQEMAADMGRVENLTLETSYGKIVFDREPVNLGEIISLGDLVKIESKLVAIDSAKAAGINKPATVTLYNTGLTRPLVKKAAGFTSDASLAREVTNIVATVGNRGEVTFGVPGFSTYVIVENTPAELRVPAEVVFDEARGGATVEKNFTVENAGAIENLENIQLSSTAGSDYQARFYDNLGNELNTFSLGAGARKEIKVKAVIPGDEEGGKDLIGDIKLVYGGKTKTIPLYIQTRSVLEIKEVKLNGKSNGEFKLGEENEIEVEVRNNGQAEIEDISVKLIVEDVEDEDDLEEESEEFDLDSGDREEQTFKFNVDSDLDEDEYKVVVKIESDGREVNTWEKKFQVERENHKVAIREASLPETVYCNKYPTLYVSVENQGKSKEEDVTVKISSDSLGISMEKTGIELDKYSEDDNQARVGFTLDLSNTEAGTYQVGVGVYRGDGLEDSKTLSVVVGDCVTSFQKEAKTQTYSAEELASQIEKQLPPILPAATPTTTTVKTSFRDSDAYLISLAILVGLVFIAVILGFLVLLVKR